MTVYVIAFDSGSETILLGVYSSISEAQRHILPVGERSWSDRASIYEFVMDRAPDRSQLSFGHDDVNVVWGAA